MRPKQANDKEENERVQGADSPARSASFNAAAQLLPEAEATQERTL